MQHHITDATTIIHKRFTRFCTWIGFMEFWLLKLDTVVLPLLYTSLYYLQTLLIVEQLVAVKVMQIPLLRISPSSTACQTH